MPGRKPNVKTLVLVIVVVGLTVMQYLQRQQETPSRQGNEPTISVLFAEQRSNVQVVGDGTVIKLLADDLQGAKHQKFLLRVASDQTVLIAHNIDLAPRINNLQVGDPVSFSGEYEYNSKGGVVHWTHRDPKGKHPDGWLRHDGHLYQ